jgi:hypothetical protein
MSPPYRVRCLQAGAGLVVAANGDLTLSQSGTPAPFIATQFCVLAEKALADYLASLDLECFETQEAAIYDPVTNETLRTHCRLILGQQFPLEWAPSMYIAGDWIFLLGGEHVFVSERLKDTLAESPFKYLAFEVGLERLPG